MTVELGPRTRNSIELTMRVRIRITVGEGTTSPPTVAGG